MTTQITNIAATEFSNAYSTAEVTNMPAMTIAQLDELTESLGVDILIF